MAGIILLDWIFWVNYMFDFPDLAWHRRRHHKVASAARLKRLKIRSYCDEAGCSY
jgi:hypothetical protein